MTATTRAWSAGSGKNKLSRKLDVNFIKDSITPLDFYRHELPGTQFKKNEWNDAGICPFHADKKAGSFMVNVETGSYICFSCGMKGGDIIAFKMTQDGLDFVDALTMLAEDWGLL